MLSVAVLAMHVERRASVLPRAADIVDGEVRGVVPPEIWNRIGTRLLPKLCAGCALRTGVSLT